MTCFGLDKSIRRIGYNNSCLKKKKTVDYYDQQAKEWVSTHNRIRKKSFWNKELIKFNKLLTKGKILEIGSGSGDDSNVLINMGFEYIGTDASEGLIKLAKNKYPNTIFIKKEVENLDFPKNSFDGFWTAATLLHIPKNKINSALENIKSVNKKGSIGFISLKEGIKNSEEKETGRWFSFYKKNEFDKILKRNDFEIIEFEYKDDERPNKPRWLLYFVRV